MPPVLSTPTITLLIAHSFAVIPLNLSPLQLQRTTVSCGLFCTKQEDTTKEPLHFQCYFYSKQPMPQHSLLCILTPFIQFSMNCILSFIFRHAPYYSTCSKRKREHFRFCCALLSRILQYSYCLTVLIDTCISDL